MIFKSAARDILTHRQLRLLVQKARRAESEAKKAAAVAVLNLGLGQILEVPSKIKQSQHWHYDVIKKYSMFYSILKTKSRDSGASIIKNIRSMFYSILKTGFKTNLFYTAPREAASSSQCDWEIDERYASRIQPIKI